jgi:hypothetical protein
VTDGTLVWHLDVVVPVPWPGVTLLDWTTTSATTDFDFLPDPGESVGLSLLVQNSGTLATAGVVQGTLTWNAAGAPGSVTTTSALPFGSAALAPGATATASPFNIQVDPAAVPHTKILMDLALTDGTNSWNRALAIPLFYHLGTDTQGDGASGVDLQAAYFFCDNTDLIVRIASFGTFNPTSSGFSLVVADTSGNVYRLRAVNGVLSAQSWQASGWVAEAAPPASLAITPTSGTTAVITFQVKLADLTKLQLAGKAAKLAIESVDPYYLTIDDALPNGWDGADFTKLIAVTWP